MSKAMPVNPLEVVQEQYQLLMARFLRSTNVGEKIVLLRRMMNLHCVRRFLLSIENHNHQGPEVEAV